MELPKTHAKKGRKKTLRGRKAPWLAALVLLAAILLYGQWVHWLSPSNPSDISLVSVEIPPSASTSQIARQLHQAGLIRSPRAFQIYTRLKGLDRSLQAGEYLLSASFSIPQLLDKLTSGRIQLHSLTVPEGYRLEQVGQLLEQKGIIPSGEFLQQVAQGEYDFWFLQGIPSGNRRLEGFLFPDTYNVPQGITADELIGLMLRRFDEVFNQDLRERAEASDLSILQIITLASIVEREAKLDEERPLVASVFLNRLKRGQPLESCATVQYALGETREVLLYEDLKVDSPYNTYLHPGLPPGPIASPGKKSIMAVLTPADTDYLFFVARQDGSHVFSRTLEEHLAAKNRIRGS